MLRLCSITAAVPDTGKLLRVSPENATTVFPKNICKTITYLHINPKFSMKKF